MRLGKTLSPAMAGGALRYVVLSFAALVVLGAAQPSRACPVVICGKVVHDLNCDGKFEKGEPYLPGVTVSLYDSNGNFLKSKVTGPLGGWQFGSMTLGYFTVVETIPAGYTASGVRTGSGTTKVNNTTILVNATSIGAHCGNFFLLCTAPPSVQICGNVFNDLNCSGVLQGSDPPVGGVTAQLFDSSNNLVATTSTDSSGHYCFTGIPPGTYTVVETVPANFIASNALPGDAGSFVNTITIQVAATTAGVTYNNENYLICAQSQACGFTTVTQGGWGSPPNGGNPGAILEMNFGTVYPSGFSVGGTNTITFLASTDVEGFLPQGGTPGVLTQSYSPPLPGSTEAGEFAGQVTALQISVDFSAAGVFQTGLGALHLTQGPLAGDTVSQVLAIANAVLGGNTGALPPGMSVSNLNDVIDALNQSFDNGGCGDGYLGP